ncbi:MULTISPECIES: hypothetical protein [Streptosporangium]|uniref:Acyl-CoA synthetase (AMP-forming)/AMP-acid ligase II n=1 Tax=Streptosporangium album TaxID=47479 RepID=A0A7W7WCM7_9ACTN|nr:hypothetical protein [Streptosporangium album]MBB4942777.1 acyl-CoA synthetase (AMP-forming)/AMP-acid ligase II [Streptosporangium album]
MTTEIPFTYAQQLLLGLEQAVPGSVLNSTFIVRAAYRVAHEVDAGAGARERVTSARLACTCVTSGSTGTPKPVTVSRAALAWSTGARPTAQRRSPGSCSARPTRSTARLPGSTGRRPAAAGWSLADAFGALGTVIFAGETCPPALVGEHYG